MLGATPSSSYSCILTAVSKAILCGRGAAAQIAHCTARCLQTPEVRLSCAEIRLGGPIRSGNAHQSINQVLRLSNITTAEQIRMVQYVVQVI